MADRRLDPDRLTALEAAPADARPALGTLWELDLAFADVVATTSDPRLGAIRMAWWRERLEAMDAGGTSPEPRLQAVHEQLVPRGISGIELSKLEDGWIPLLDPFPWGDGQIEGLRVRGRILFGIGARLLGGEREGAEAAGALWSLVDGATHCSDAPSREHLRQAALAATDEVPRRLPAKVRPLTILAALAAYDLGHGGRLGRVRVAMTHQLRGTIPHG